jgi:hypothetical protein
MARGESCGKDSPQRYSPLATSHTTSVKMQVPTTPKTRRMLNQVELEDLRRKASKGNEFFVSLFKQAQTVGLTSAQLEKARLKSEDTVSITQDKIALVFGHAKAIVALLDDKSAPSSIPTPKSIVKRTQDEFDDLELDLEGYQSDPIVDTTPEMEKTPPMKKTGRGQPPSAQKSKRARKEHE